MTEQLEIPGTSPFDACTGHYHVGANMVGYLPEGDVLCADNVADAVQFLLSLLQEAQNECADYCNDTGTDHDGCEWCANNREMTNIVNSAEDGTQDLHRRVLANGGFRYVYTPPEGADISYWIEPQADTKTDAHNGKFSRADICPVMMEQNDLFPFEYRAEHQGGAALLLGSGPLPDLRRPYRHRCDQS